MSTFISPKGEYPRYIGNIQNEHPNWDMSEPLPNGWLEVEDVPMPTAEWDFRVKEAMPELVDGVYKRVWQTVELTDAEKERRDAPKTAKAKLIKLGLTELEVEALVRGLI